MRHQHGLSRPLFATLICAAALAASASEFIVDFNPASPANTSGWDFGQSTPQDKTAQSPAGRKLAPDKGESAFIASPVHSSRIRAVAVSFNCVNAKNGNAAKVEVFGRASESDEYQILFFTTGLPGTPTNLCSTAFATPLDDFDCRQVKIVYTKDNSSLNGNLCISSVTFSDGAVRAATPTNLRAEVVDAVARRVRVRWDLAEGISDSRWRTFTTTTDGGVEASAALWRESFDGVPAVTAAKEIEVGMLAGFGLADGWEAEVLRQPTTAGALLIGWEKSVTGSLTTPPLGQSFAAGNLLVLNAASRDVASGVMPVSVIAGGVTSCVAEVAIAKTPQEIPVSLPALAPEDRILVQSLTNYAQRATLVYDLAICSPDAYLPETVVTNDVSSATAVSESFAEVTVPVDGTNLWLEACATYEGEDSDWTDPFLVVFDLSALEELTDRCLSLDRRGNVDATFDPAALPDATDASLDVSGSPFRFLLDGNERLAISRNKDATKSFSAGVYVCTNVFERDWLVLTPYAAETLSDVKTAEMRVAIESGDFSLRKVTLSGEFAQLGASNEVARTLQFQWRTVVANGAAPQWQDFGEYVTTCTATDAPGDLRETVREVVAEATPRTSAGARLKAGARVEVRILNERRKGQKEAPLGFRNFSVRAESADRAILFVIR